MLWVQFSQCLHFLITETRSAATVLYARDTLLSLAPSPLAATCQPLTQRLAAMTAILSAEPSPTKAQAGIDIKNRSDSPLCPPNALQRRVYNGSLRSSTSDTRENLRTHNKVAFNSSIPFDHEKCATMYTTPFTPNPSLMKPVDMSEWTPSITTPLDTPFIEMRDSSATGLDSKAMSATECKGLAPEKEGLRPTAKIFIPTDTPILHINPQPQRDSLCSSRHTIKYQTPPAEKPFDAHSSLGLPIKSLPSVGTMGRFEVPKAITPLAAPSSCLPPRPTACAVTPNLPRWAHSPTHAMISSVETRFQPVDADDKSREPSLIRRARAATISQKEGSEDLRLPGSLHFCKLADDTGEKLGGIPTSHVSSSHISGSRTPWALKKTDIELRIKGNDDGVSSLGSPVTTAKTATHMSSDSTPISATSASEIVQVSSVRHVKEVTAFDGNSWRRQVQGSFSQPPRRPSMTPSIPGGLLGAVPMHSVSIK